jgi:hypothetical protein
MKDLGIRRCVDMDGTMFPDTRSLFRIIPESKPTTVMDIVDHFLEWFYPRIAMVGAKHGAPEGVVINNGKT